MREGRATRVLLVLLTLGGGAAGAAVSADVRGSTSIPLTFEGLVRESSSAAFVTPMTQTAVWEQGRIVTYTNAHVDSAISGAAAERPESTEIWVRTLGGEVGHIGQSVEGEASLEVGHPCLLFLRPAITLPIGVPAEDPAPLPGVLSVTGRAQGEFPLVAGKDGQLTVSRSYNAGAMLAPKGAVMGLLAADVLHGLHLSEARDAVTAAWSQLHAR